MSKEVRISFADVPTHSNRSERLPCVLVVDASDSMGGQAIDELNAGLRVLEADLKSDQEAKRRVRVLVILVSGEHATKIVDWVDAEKFTAPHLSATGRTPLGSGVRLAMSEIKAEMQRLEAEGIARKIPWLWIFTDGEPTDEGWQSAAAECSAAHGDNKLLVFPIAVGDDASEEKLGSFSKDNRIYQINALSFKEFFKFLSASARAGSAKAGVTIVTPLFSQVSG